MGCQTNPLAWCGHCRRRRSTARPGSAPTRERSWKTPRSSDVVQAVTEHGPRCTRAGEARPWRASARVRSESVGHFALVEGLQPSEERNPRLPRAREARPWREATGGRHFPSIETGAPCPPACRWAPIRGLGESLVGFLRR
jgi:hypothetical protein